jgi:hypothetical protein
MDTWSKRTQTNPILSAEAVGEGGQTQSAIVLVIQKPLILG